MPPPFAYWKSSSSSGPKPSPAHDRFTNLNCSNLRPRPPLRVVGDKSPLLAGIAVGQTWVPVCAPTFGCEIQQVPQRPNHIDVALVLSWFGRNQQKFGVVGLVDLPSAANKDIQRGLLAAFRIFAVVAEVLTSSPP
jgi:hypothetical protein